MIDLLVLAITFILLGALVAVPSRTESVAIEYSKIENVDDNTKKVTATYKGQEKVLTVTKEVNWAPKLKWIHTIDQDKKIVSIEYNPDNEKDFEVFSGPPQYVGSVFLIFLGVVALCVSIGFSYPFFMIMKDEGVKKAFEALSSNE